MALSLRVDVVSDVVCPWCFIGSKRLKRVLSSEAAAPFGSRIDVFWHPYRLLSPTMQPMRKVELYRQKFGPKQFEMALKHVTNEGVPLGIKFNYMEESMLGPTTDAHRLAGWISHDKQQALMDSFFSAHHEKGLLISDPDVLLNCVEQAGGDRRAAAVFLGSDDGRAQVDEDIRNSPQKFSMAGGVPHFVLTITGGAQPVKAMVSGAQNDDYFRIILERALKKSAQPADE